MEMFDNAGDLTCSNRILGQHLQYEIRLIAAAPVPRHRNRNGVAARYLAAIREYNVELTVDLFDPNHLIFCWAKPVGTRGDLHPNLKIWIVVGDKFQKCFCDVGVFRGGHLSATPELVPQFKACHVHAMRGSLRKSFIQKTHGLSDELFGHGTALAVSTVEQSFRR